MEAVASVFVFIIFIGLAAAIYALISRRFITKLPPPSARTRTGKQKVLHGIGEVAASASASVVLLFLIAAMFASDSEPTTEAKVIACICLVSIPIVIIIIHRTFTR